MSGGVWGGEAQNTTLELGAGNRFNRDPTPPETPPSDFGNAPRWSHEIALRKDSFDFAIAFHDCFACIYNANLEICQKAVKKLQKLSKVKWHSLRASEPPSFLVPAAKCLGGIREAQKISQDVFEDD